MSYLDSPRLVFRGWFQADVSTINNDVRTYQNDSFVPAYQDLNANGSWNPDGTGAFRLVDCKVTGAVLGDRTLKPGDDPVLAMTLQNADRRAPGKLVDLDPQQQMVSTIWGMQVRLASASQAALFKGEYEPAAFTDLWARQQTAVKGDQTLAAFYQSVLSGVEWSPHLDDSPFLRALAEATSGGRLSIRFNVYGYGRDPTIPRYTMGHVVGSIGPYRAGEPHHFVVGRQGLADIPPAGFPMAPAYGISNFQAVVATDGGSLTLDLGNTLPVVSANGGLADMGPIALGVLKTNPSGPVTAITDDQVAVIGQIFYLDPAWYTSTAGVQRFALPPDAQKVIDGCPLVLMAPTSSGYKVLVQESIGGLYVRADSFVYRLDPGESRNVTLYASQFGKPISTLVNLSATEGFMGGSGGGPGPLKPPTKPEAVIPDIATPTDGVTWPASVTTKNGVAHVPITASKSGPGQPRGYISGQLYGLSYALADQPATYISNPFDYVSILAFSGKDVPANPTWYADIAPLFTQYSNVYPIMGKYLFDLGDYARVVQHLEILTLAFSLPIENPNHMPVTRDLGAGDRATILKWLSMKGPDGLPPLGTPPAVKATPVATGPADIVPPDGTRAGKTSFIENYKNRKKGGAS